MEDNPEKGKNSDENINKDVQNENEPEIEKINLNKDEKQQYSYSDSIKPVSNFPVNNYNYGNRYNYSNNNNNGNYNTYQFPNNQNTNQAYYKQGNKFGTKFILILCACALAVCILIGIAGLGMYNFLKGSVNNGPIGSNGNNNYNNRTFNNGNNNLPTNSDAINYDNFAKITSTSTLDDVKNLLKTNPISEPVRNSATLTQYTFAGAISVTFDKDGTIIDKIIDSSFVDFPSSTANVTFDEFQKLKPKMPLSNIESTFKSKGVLTESTYKAVEGYFFAGDSYTWPTNGLKASKSNYIICDFDSNNALLRAQNYDKSLVLSSDNGNIDKGIFGKFNGVNMGMSYDEVKSSFGSDPIMQDIGIPNNYQSNYYYSYKDAKIIFIFDENNKVIARWITSKDYGFYDVNAKNFNDINNIKEGMSYDNVKNILGSDGYLCYEDSIDSKDYIAKVKSYIWIFNDNSGIQIDFDFSTPEGKAIQMEDL